MSRCDHADYDDYFEVCTSCQMTGEQIHAEQCKSKLIKDEEYGRWLCDDCGAYLVHSVEEAA